MIEDFIPWLAERLKRDEVAAHTAAHLQALAREPMRASRQNVRMLLQRLARDRGPKLCLGNTEFGEPVIVPLSFLVEACSVITGGMGSGKSLFATLIIEALIQHMPQLGSLSFGVLDAKGELFDRARFLLGRRLAELTGEAKERLMRRILVVDFSGREAVTSYNILKKFEHTEADYFIASRLETLKELLPSGDKLSLRGGAVLKQILLLLSEFDLPITFLDRLISDEDFRLRLAAQSRNPDVRMFFERRLKSESPQTLAALRVRMETLVASDGVRLALSGRTAPDFRALQNAGKIVLVNCAGPMITRGVRMLLQGLILSDIRQAVFARPTEPPVKYLWFADEAQNFLRNREQVEHLNDLLSMARSFGSYFSLICQNLSTAVPDSRVLDIIFTNIRWSMSFRGTPQDTRFLRPALPVTGRRMRPEPDPFRERSFHSSDQERSLLLEGIASLPDFTGYFWPRSLSSEAMKLTTGRPNLPRGREFEIGVRYLRDLAEFGGRMSRADHERMVEERDSEWKRPIPDQGNLEQQFETAYRKEHGK